MQLPKRLNDGWEHDDFAQTFQGACEAQVAANDRLAEGQKALLTREKDAVEGPRVAVVAAQQALDAHRRAAYPRLRGAASVHDYLCDQGVSETNEFLDRREAEVRAAQTTALDLLSQPIRTLRGLGRRATAALAVAIAGRLLARLPGIAGVAELAVRLRARGEAFGRVVDQLDAAEDRGQALQEDVVGAVAVLRRQLVGAYGRLLAELPKPLVESVFPKAPAKAKRGPGSGGGPGTGGGGPTGTPS